MTEDLNPVSNSVYSALAGLGLSHFRVTLQLIKHWDEFAGEPWAGQTRPLGIKDGELIVETAVPGIVSLFRYATSELHKRLEERFGEGIIDRVTVQPPPQRTSR